jgi:hypothetical protein
LAGEIGDGVQKSDRDKLIFIQGNLAHALLFQGHYDEALANLPPIPEQTAV